MRKFLDDYVDTLSGRRQERVANILESARVGKSELSSIIDRIARFGSFSPVDYEMQQEGSIIESSVHFATLRDFHQRVIELFERSNLISVALESEKAILGYEAKVLEDELMGLEKAIENYSFLLSDHGAFHYAFLESFTDGLGVDDSVWEIPDKNGRVFGPAERAQINTDEGTISIPHELSIRHPLNANLVKGNASAYIVSNSGLEEALVESGSSSWQIQINAPSPIDSPLAEDPTSGPGAEVLLEFRLPTPSPSAQIKLVPISDNGVKLVSVATYDSLEEGATAHQLLESPINFSAPITLNFPMRPVARFRVLLSQSTYQRKAIIHNPEDDYIRLTTLLWERLKAIRSAVLVSRSPSYADAMHEILNGPAHARSLFAVTAVARPIVMPVTHPAFTPAPGWGWIQDIKPPQVADDNSLENRASRIRILTEAEKLVFKLFDTQNENYRDLATREVRKYLDTVKESFPEAFNPQLPVKRTDILKEGFDYSYKLGLSYVGIGSSDTPNYRAVYVSKPLYDAGDVGEVRIKVSEKNYSVLDTPRGISLYTSTEYSVSNIAVPTREADWIPIQPIGQALVRGERLYPNDIGVAYFRFPASRFDDVSIFKNGYALTNLADDKLIVSDNAQAILGIRFPQGFYNPEDFLVASYTPNADFSTVSFEDYGFSIPSVASAFDNEGAGEGFSGTAGRNLVELSRTPYLDPEKVSDSLYSPTFGMTPYQPLLVYLNDGTVPINLTDYRPYGEQAPLPPSGGYYYIHSGRNLIFNQPITGGLRVYYSYLENNVRVRVVMRTNDRDFVSPKVDYYHIKAKVRLADNREM